MREMKESNIQWLGKIPQNWNLIKGKYLFALRTTRGNHKRLKLLSPTQQYGVISQDEYEKLSGMKAVKLKQDTDLSSLRTIHKGDYCISLRSFQGGFEYCNQEGVVSPAYQVFYPTVPISHAYYRLLFKNDGFIAEMNSFTMSLRDGKNIAFKDFGDSLIPYPNLQEQQAIADYLDAKCADIDALQQDLQAEIETLQAYKKSLITRAVTQGLDPNVEMKDSGVEWIGKIPKNWKVVRLEFVSYIRSRLGWKGLKADEYVDEGYAFISAFNIQNGQLVWAPLNYITKERYDESPEIKIHKGDVLIVKDGAGVGKSARVDDLPYGETAPNSSISVITPYEQLEYRYLAYYFQSAVFNNLVLKLLNGMGVPHLTQSILKNIKICLPPINQQTKISTELDSQCARIDSITADKQKQLQLLSDYKKSLIYEVVTGKKEVPVHE